MIIDRIKGHLAVEYEKRIIVLDDDFGEEISVLAHRLYDPTHIIVTINHTIR